MTSKGYEKMKVLQVCAYAAPYEGNFIKSLKMLERRLKENEIEMLYAFPESAREISWCKQLSKQAKVYFLPLAKARIKYSTYAMLKKIYMENPDIAVVHSHFELYDIPVVMMASKGVKVFWHLHDGIEVYSDIKNRVINWLQYGVFHNNATLLSVSEKHKDYVVRLGFPGERAFYLPNGIDLDRIQWVKDDKEHRKYDFLMFGWEFERKGVDLCVEACKRIQKDINVAIVGEKAMEERIQQMGLSRGIDVIEPISDINELYRQAKCFLHISRAEGLSYALLEAIYAGLSVICSDIDENKFAEKFPTVQMVKNGDVESILHEMMQYTVRKNDNENAIVRAREIIEREYSVKSWTERILNYYGVKND